MENGNGKRIGRWMLMAIWPIAVTTVVGGIISIETWQVMQIMKLTPDHPRYYPRDAERDQLHMKRYVDDKMDQLRPVDWQRQMEIMRALLTEANQDRKDLKRRIKDLEAGS